MIKIGQTLKLKPQYYSNKLSVYVIVTAIMDDCYCLAKFESINLGSYWPKNLVEEAYTIEQEPEVVTIMGLCIAGQSYSVNPIKGRIGIEINEITNLPTTGVCVNEITNLPTT